MTEQRLADGGLVRNDVMIGIAVHRAGNGVGLFLIVFCTTYRADCAGGDTGVSTFSNEVPRALCSICSSSALRRIRTLCICLAALNSKFSLKSPYDLASAISLLFSGIFVLTSSSYSSLRFSRLLQETIRGAAFSWVCAPVIILSSSG